MTPPVVDNLGTAILLMAQVHEHQVDKANETYALHAFEVMRMVAPDRDAMIVAILHDTIEDEKDPVRRIKLIYNLERSFSSHIMEAVLALTHKEGESYTDYIERVAENYLATIVKIADLTHNMDPRRIPADQIVDKDFQRWDKYRKALIRLKRGILNAQN